MEFGKVRKQLGQIGVWSREAYFGDPDEVTNLATVAEELGYGVLWIPGYTGGPIFERCRQALEATSSLTVATGVINIWCHDASDVAGITNFLRDDSGGRFLLGIGGSHKQIIGDDYDKISPLAKMRGYLDELDAAGQLVEDRFLGALAPKMLELCAARSLGTHPYFVPPEHTAAAREVLGDGPLLMPEHKVILETDPREARAIARKFAKLYLRTPNYINNLRRLGYGDDDLGGGGSDRFIDAVFAWGEPRTIAARVRAHLDAGADHVTIQSFGPRPTSDVWRELAPELLG